MGLQGSQCQSVQLWGFPGSLSEWSCSRRSLSWPGAQGSQGTLGTGRLVLQLMLGALVGRLTGAAANAGRGGPGAGALCRVAGALGLGSHSAI